MIIRLLNKSWPSTTAWEDMERSYPVLQEVMEDLYEWKVSPDGFVDTRGFSEDMIVDFAISLRSYDCLKRVALLVRGVDLARVEDYLVDLCDPSIVLDFATDVKGADRLKLGSSLIIKADLMEEVVRDLLKQGSALRCSFEEWAEEELSVVEPLKDVLTTDQLRHAARSLWLEEELMAMLDQMELRHDLADFAASGDQGNL